MKRIVASVGLSLSLLTPATAQMMPLTSQRPATPAQPAPAAQPSSPAATPSNASARPLILDATPMPIAGTLNLQFWQNYRQRFVTDKGRVVDTANSMVSHSEGQGYGMLLAVAARDRAGFERIWNWTRANLMVRGDQLV